MGTLSLTFTLIFGRLRERIELKCVPHVQRDYFCLFNQSDHCFLASSLPLPLSLLKLPYNIMAQLIDNHRFSAGESAHGPNHANDLKTTQDLSSCRSFPGSLVSPYPLPSTRQKRERGFARASYTCPSSTISFAPTFPSRYITCGNNFELFLA